MRDWLSTRRVLFNKALQAWVTRKKIIDVKKIVVLLSEGPLKGHFTLITLHRSHGKTFTSRRTIFLIRYAPFLRNGYWCYSVIIHFEYLNKWNKKKRRLQTTTKMSFIQLSAYIPVFLLYDFIFIVSTDKKKSDNQGWRSALEADVNEV